MDQALQAGLQPSRSVPDGIPAMLLAALPGGWRLLGRCRFGTAGPVGPASGCHALAHATIGLALVDVAPDATPNAEARLRRALGAEDFWQAFPGMLPVWHGRIEIGAVRQLPGLMAEGFSTLPPLTVPGKEAWIEAARKALAADPAWEVPGQPPRQRVPTPSLPPEDDAEDDLPRRAPVRRRGRWVAVGVAALAMLVGIAWLGTGVPEAEAPIPPIQVQVAAAPRPAVVVQPEPPLPVVERVVVALPVPVELPPEPPVLRPPEPEPAAAAPEPPPVPVVQDIALILPPPAPPPAPPLRRAAAPARIDPGCTRALYRYQQGLPMTAAEAAHVRDGCATRR